MTEREMSSAAGEKRHVVCIPLPAQGHITPMLDLAKLLHSCGFHITFINTEYNHRCLLRSLGQTSLTSIPDFQFMAINDGLPLCNEDDIPHLASVYISLSITGPPRLKDLLNRLNNSCSDIPRVTCVIADSIMSFVLDVAKEMDTPCVLLWTSSSCSFMGCFQFRNLIDRGLVPLKELLTALLSDLDQLGNGYLDTLVDSVPGMTNMKLRDFPAFMRTTDINDTLLNISMHSMENQSKASVIIMHTFDELEHTVLLALKSIMSPPIYCIGPLPLLVNQIVSDSRLNSLSLNLWKEEQGCLEWLKEKRARSVVYINFGSIAVLSSKQLVELAWGLANSKYEFIWVLRPDVVRDSGMRMLPQEFLDEVKERGLIANWCPQSAVLAHEAIGLFLTHSGWNSTLESISNGVPMLSLPRLADQPTNCRYVCTEWQIGMELDNDVKRDDVEKSIRVMMEGAGGKRMKENAMKWKESAKKAAQHDGSSFLEFQKLIYEVLASKNE